MNQPSHSIQITLDNEAGAFEPGEPIRGVVRWQGVDFECDSIEVRLIWFTRGKGDRDFEVIHTRVHESPGEQGDQHFEFDAPEYPPSFSGKLISLIWNIEVILFPTTDAEHREIIISPGKQPLAMDMSSVPSKIRKPVFKVGK